MILKKHFCMTCLASSSSVSVAKIIQNKLLQGGVEDDVTLGTISITGYGTQCDFFEMIITEALHWFEIIRYFLISISDTVDIDYV